MVSRSLLLDALVSLAVLLLVPNGNRDAELIVFGVGLVLTAILMLALQLVFSPGAIYLVAESAGRVGSSGLLFQIGRVLGSRYLTGPFADAACCPPDAQTTRPAHPPKSKRKRAPVHVASTRMRLAPVAITVAGVFVILLLTGGPGALTTGTGSTTSAGFFAPA